MHDNVTATGIPAVGPVPWGSHFCQLYETPTDMADILVPYFKSGLERNELCHWVTSEHFGVEDAKSALRAHYAHLDRAIDVGQITIMDRREWYQRDDRFDPATVVGGWLAHEEKARLGGYSGYRLTGDTLWLEPHQWDEFTVYEQLVNDAFGTRRMIALCTYCMGKCGAAEVLDLVSTHAFAVARRRGHWELVESPSIKTAKSELAQLNSTLAIRIDEATKELQTLIGHKEALLKEVHHRVKNNLQIVANLLTMKSSRAPDQAREVLLETAERVHAISAVHEALYRDADDGGVDVIERLETIAAGLTATYGIGNRVTVQVAGDPIRLPLNAAVPLALLATELLSNAMKHAFPGTASGRIDVSIAHMSGGGFTMGVTDDGVGPVGNTSQRRGSGLHIATALARQLGGVLSIHPNVPRGLDARLVVEAA